MEYQGSCHCGRIAFTVQAEAPISDVIDCNCSMCRRRGSLLWFAPRAAFQLTTDPPTWPPTTSTRPTSTITTAANVASPPTAKRSTRVPAHRWWR